MSKPLCRPFRRALFRRKHHTIARAKLVGFGASGNPTRKLIYRLSLTPQVYRTAFLRLHAQGIIACDFFVVVTATFSLRFVFVVIEHHRPSSMA